jgi:hypothetical protein
MTRAYIKLEPSYQTASMTAPRDKRATIRLGSYRIPMPGTRRQRSILGAGLCLGGIVGFLPIVGFWMLPLGLVVLSVNSHAVRRWRRRMEIRWGKYRKASAAKHKATKRKGRE